jgi:hypothetical protein
VVVAVQTAAVVLQGVLEVVAAKLAEAVAVVVLVPRVVEVAAQVVPAKPGL